MTGWLVKFSLAMSSMPFLQGANSPADLPLACWQDKCHGGLQAKAPVPPADPCKQQCRTRANDPPLPLLLVLNDPEHLRVCLRQGAEPLWEHCCKVLLRAHGGDMYSTEQAYKIDLRLGAWVWPTTVAGFEFLPGAVLAHARGRWSSGREQLAEAGLRHRRRLCMLHCAPALPGGEQMWSAKD
jgi:hypothetical protein